MAHNVVGVHSLSFSSRSMRELFLLLAVAVWVGLFGRVVHASDAEGERVDVLAAGNDQIVWLCERRVEGDKSVLRLAYCRAADSEDLAFRPLRIPALSGEVVAAAARDENLHVFFSDGTHMRFVPPGEARPLVAVSARGVEVTLPGRAVPRLIVADASTQVLYALVAGEVAVQLPERVAVDDDSEGAVEVGVGVGVEVEDGVGSESESGLGDDVPVGGTKEEEAAVGSLEVAVEAPFAFVRYEGGSWVRDRWAVKGLEDGADVVAVWIRDGAIDLLTRRGGVGAFEHSVSASREVEWSESVITEISSEGRSVGSVGVVGAVGAGWTLAGPVLVVREGKGNAARLVGYRKDDLGWKALPPFVLTKESRAALARVSSLALMESRAVVVDASSGAVEAGSWSVTTGEELDAMAPVIAFAPTSSPAFGNRLRYAVPFVIFAAVLIYVFITRRDGGLFRVAVGPTDQVADLQARFFALLLDLAITFPVWGGILYFFMYDDLAALSMFEQMRNPTPALEMVLPVISVVEALYGLVFEIAMRATIGKRMMGLKVVAEGGGRAKGGAIVVRNLMRVLEFQFPAVAVLVFLTPSRQRLGDVLSRTLVVQRVSILPEVVKQNEGEAEAKG
jgi:uncharacterized RDD family membrane protein YckC